MTRLPHAGPQPGPVRVRRWVGVGVSTGLVVAGLGVGAAPAVAGDPAPIVSSSDQAALTSMVGTANGGRVTTAPSRTGSGGLAMRFPAFDPDPSGARAVVLARSAGAVDVLNPGTADFSVGAEVLLDQESERKAPGSDDNGNNVLQRGLFDSSTQYKIQLDSGKASCRIKGSAGAVMVKSKTLIVPGQWFGVACSRIGTTVSLAVTSWVGTAARTQVVSATGATGDLTPTDPTMPFAVGAKVHDKGSFTSSSDQFNGAIDNPYLRVGDRLVTVTMPAEPVGLIATTSHLTVNKPNAPKKHRVRLSGTVSPGGATAGSKVVLKLKRKGKPAKRLGEKSVSTTGAYRFTKVKVREGRYKVIFPRQGNLLKSKALLVYKHGAFRTR